MLCSGCVRGFPEEPEVDTMRRDAIRHLSATLSEAAVRAAMHRRLGDAATPEAVAHVVEHGIAVWSEAKARQYARKLYSLLWALRSEPNLLARADPWDLAFLREESLIQSSSWAAGNEAGAVALATSTAASPQGSLQNAQERNLQHINEIVDKLQAELKERVERVSVVAKKACPRCGSHETERIAVQTRSADEGMTQMLQCTACGQRVRI